VVVVIDVVVDLVVVVVEVVLEAVVADKSLPGITALVLVLSTVPKSQLNSE